MSSEPSLFKQLRKNVRDTVLQVPDIERKVKAATNNDKWGPHAQDMAELARATFSYTDCPLILNAIWKRFDEPGKHWRHVYKALLLLEYLIKNGSEQVPSEAKVHLLQIKTLKDFQYIDEDRKDVGLSVRERAKKLAELIADDDAVKSERAKAAKNAGKYTGVSSDDYHSGGGGHRSHAHDDNGDDDGNGTSPRRHALEDGSDDASEEEKVKPKRKGTASKRKDTAGADSRPRAPSGGASTAAKPAAAPAPVSSSAALFDAFAPAPASAAVDPFGGSAFGAPAHAADPFGGAAFGAPAAASPFGAPAASPFGAPAAASPFGAPATASPFGAPAAASPFGAPAAASPFGAPAAASPFGAPAASPFGAPANGGGFGAPAAAAPAAAADPFGGFGGFQSAAPSTTADKGLHVDPMLSKTKNLWDLDGLGKKDESTVDDRKRSVPMGAISTTGPARTTSAAPTWATAGAAAPTMGVAAMTPQQQQQLYMQQQQQQMMMRQQQQQQFGGFSG